MIPRKRTKEGEVFFALRVRGKGGGVIHCDGAREAPWPYLWPSSALSVAGKSEEALRTCRSRVFEKGGGAVNLSQTWIHSWALLKAAVLSGSIHNCFITRTGRHVTAVNLRPVAIICCLPPQSPGDACTAHALTRRERTKHNPLGACVSVVSTQRKGGYKQARILGVPWSSSVAYPSILSLHLTAKVYPVLYSPSSSRSRGPPTA